jgi:predicted phosphodiesterase
MTSSIARRIAVVADVHGNLHALRAVVAEIRSTGVDSVVCAGDLVGYGPFPNECVDMIAGLGASSVAGNHDLMAINGIPIERVGRLVRESQEWTRAQLRPDVRDYLAGLPLKLDLGELVVAHGSLSDPSQYVVGAADGFAQLAKLALEHPSARLLVLGHTHRRWLQAGVDASATTPRDGKVELRNGMRYLLNPGSVGQSREWMPPPRAHFALLHLDAGLVDFRSVDYDVESCSAALRERGLPAYAMHLPPGRLGRAALYVRDALHG